MNPTHSMDDSQWQMLVQDVADYFDDLTIKRGFQYYKQGRVERLTTPAPRIIEALVEGTRPYRVEINLDFFTLSDCNCPVQDTCKHMIAVLLEYTNLHGRSVHMIVNVKSVPLSLQLPSKPSHGAISYNKAIQAAEAEAAAATAAEARKQAELKELAEQIPAMRVAEWHELFERYHAPLANVTRNFQYVKEALNAFEPFKRSLSAAAERLFKLHAHLFLLDKAAKQSQRQSGAFGTFMGYHTHLAISYLEDAIENCYEDGLPIADEPEHRDRIIDTLAYLRKQMLTEPPSQNYFSDPYFRLWTEWIRPDLNDAALYAEELRQLLRAKDEIGADLSRTPWLLARITMHFYLGDDPAAWTLLKAAHNFSGFHPEKLLSYLFELAEAEDWPRLVDWLCETAPLLYGQHIDHLHRYGVYWELAVRQLPDAEPRMWDALAGLLPYSRYIYEDKLVRYGKWQLWMDYLLSTGREPLDYRATELQPVERHAPEALLPFYHQAVERYVLNKNRDSYKAAVKLMKRLAKLYKRMKQETRWKQFLTAFTERHSRLRALQEELRKGKLIP